MPLGEAIFKELSKLLLKSGLKLLGDKTADFRLAAEVESKLQVCALGALNNLDTFFTAEGLPVEKQEWLVEQCLLELKPFLRKPEKFFGASLTGQKLYDQLYSSIGAPEAVRDERLEQLYKLLFPRVADPFCAYLALIPQLKATGDREIFKRFDDIQQRLAQFQSELVGLSQRGLTGANEYFNQLYNLVFNRVLGQLLVNGLHGERTYEVSLDDIFVLPTLSRPINNETQRIRTPDESANHLFSLGRRVVVEGQPGGGKTTWSRWLQRLALKNNSPKLAVHLRFRDYAKRDLPDVYSLVREPADIHLQKRLTDEVLESWLSQGRIIFLLDGFDEVAPPKRDSVRDWIDGLARSVSQAPIVVTSRPLSTDQLRELPSTWQHWGLEPFSEPQVEDYIRRWYACCPFLRDDQRSIDAAILARSWKHDKTVSDLTGNPLMLATLLTVHHRDNRQLPRGRSDLYERYLDGMLGLWEESIQVERPVKLSPKQKRQILQRYARYFLLQGIESLGEEENEGPGMGSLTSDILSELGIESPKLHEHSFARSVLEELRERTGMLDGPGTYTFVHKSVAEFLFAEIVVDGHLRSTPEDSGERIDRHWLYSRRASDRWRGVLYFWAGLAATGDRQGFIGELASSDADDDRLLGLGLLYDQLTELDQASVRNLFFRIIGRKLEGKQIGFRSWIVGALPVEIGTEIRVLDLESVAPATWYTQSAFSEIAEYLRLSQSERDILTSPWITYTWRQQIIDAMKDPDPHWWSELKAIDHALGKNGPICSLACAFLDLRRLSKLQRVPPPLVTMMLDRWPSLSSAVPVVFAGVLAEVIGDLSQIEIPVNMLANMSEVLPWVRTFQADPKLLSRTAKCSGGPPHLDIDSLRVCEKKLEEIRKSSGNGSASYLDSLYGFICELIAQREELVSGSDAS